MKRFCPICGKSSEWVKLARSEVWEVRGKKVEVFVELLVCPECGTEYEDLNREHDPYKEAQRKASE